MPPPALQVIFRKFNAYRINKLSFISTKLILLQNPYKCPQTHNNYPQEEWFVFIFMDGYFYLIKLFLVSLVNGVTISFHELRRILITGQFGQVWKGTYSIPGRKQKDIAAKVLKEGSNLDQKREFLMEAQIMVCYQHFEDIDGDNHSGFWCF